MPHTLIAGILAAAALAAVAIVALADADSTTIGGPAAPDITIAAADHGLGPMLVDGQGRTLYLWRADAGPRSRCTGACAAAWPPETTGASVRAGAGVDGALLGLARRAGGAAQVTYAGHPLYRFAGDASAGQSNGQGSDAYGAAWWPVAPAGGAITDGG